MKKDIAPINIDIQRKPNSVFLYERCFNFTTTNKRIK